MNKFCLFLLLCFAGFFSSTVKADDILKTENLSDEIVNVKIPPLHELLEKAAKNPAVGMTEEMIEIESLKLRVHRREWLSYISLKGTYNYGIMGNYSSYTDEFTPLMTTYSGTTQNAWVIGGMFSMPLSDIFTRPTKTKMLKKQVEYSKHSRDLAIENVKLRIIDLYTNIEVNINLLKTKIGSVEFLKSQYDIAQKDFISGRKSFETLVTPRNNMVKAIDEYENCRGALKSLIIQLELLSGERILQSGGLNK